MGYGMMGLSAFYGKPLPDEERLEFLDHVYESGCTNWDSADMYGDSEDLLGKWFKKSGKRNEIFLATKFANRVFPDGSREINSTPEYARQACEKSLKRLGVDHIDLYYCHRVDKKTPIEQTIKAMAELKKEGKIKYIGISEVSADTLRRGCKVEHIDALQIEYSPFTMDIEYPEVGVLKACRELGIAIVAYSPLGRGFLTGGIKSPDDFEKGDFRTMSPRFQGENFKNNLELVHALKDIADKKGCTPGQLTLAFLMAQGEDVIPIPGTTKIKNFKENMAALKIQLTKDELAKIRETVEKAEVTGVRYPEA